MIDFTLDRKSGTATYAQLIQQVEHALRLGLLMPGDQLPTAKQVVGRLAINPNTVLRAYRELEARGLVEALPGLGTFVRRSLVAPHDPELEASLGEWVATAREAGLGDDDMRSLLEFALSGHRREIA
ncbi:GntR family transcriptional regulator [Acrocarpospora macrocephala]|uniref:GntR family transcriptional regulator n=2 Tax=Acrocarpospora TaxID=90974 RepID=A0A5M3XNU9_9ACTN|nr:MULTISPECIES: GntR family transcriptional regulator [Acrocarpospora]GES16129.1 GntR family transcriptional regulator [Acrocarpospora macrocephala]GES23017.1 GntR family transcriptional regulator [Acrocarpospora pleiomorpha]